MRTTVFAFMGLLAAAGLALVAIFAQLGFPLVSPEPLPSDPSRFNAVAGAKVVIAGQDLGAAVPAPRARAVSDDREDGIAAGGVGSGGRGNPATPVELPTPAAPVSPPADSGGVAVSPPPAPDPTPAPAPSRSQSSTPTPARPPVPAPPSTPEAAPPPPPPPPPVAAPGNSASTAAAEHASPRGIEASASANGKALGHYK